MKRSPIARSTKPMQRTELRQGKPLPVRSQRAIRGTRGHVEVRTAVFARDGWLCRLRGVPGAGDCYGYLTFHHRRKASQGGLYTVENGATLCCSHNDRLESDADLAALGVRLGLVIRAGCP